MINLKAIVKSDKNISECEVSTASVIPSKVRYGGSATFIAEEHQWSPFGYFNGYKFIGWESGEKTLSYIKNNITEDFTDTALYKYTEYRLDIPESDDYKVNICSGNYPFGMILDIELTTEKEFCYWEINGIRFSNNKNIRLSIESDITLIPIING